MRDLIKTVSRGHRLSEADAASAMRTIMRGAAKPTQIAGLAMALAARGESVEEIVGMARAARELSTAVPIDTDVLDICGTGGDGLDTFNISTASALVAAACGVRVAKHGNRSSSSRCGSADVLEELGVDVELGPDAAARCLEAIGITFLSAPVFNPGFRHAAGPRRELGARTVFNLLGPLCNPARVRFQALGVPDAQLVAPMAEVLRRLGVTRALVFHSHDGMDELSTGAPSEIVEILAGRRREYRIDPAELGLPTAHVDDLVGGDRRTNADIIRRVVAGERGPARDVVLLNAAAALRISGRAEDWRDGLLRAGQAIDGDEVSKLLDRWIDFSRRPGGAGPDNGAPRAATGPTDHQGALA